MIENATNVIAEETTELKIEVPLDEIELGSASEELVLSEADIANVDKQLNTQLEKKKTGTLEAIKNIFSAVKQVGERVLLIMTIAVVFSAFASEDASAQGSKKKEVKMEDVIRKPYGMSKKRYIWLLEHDKWELMKLVKKAREEISIETIKTTKKSTTYKISFWDQGLGKSREVEFEIDKDTEYKNIRRADSDGITDGQYIEIPYDDFGVPQGTVIYVRWDDGSKTISASSSSGYEGKSKDIDADEAENKEAL